MSEYPPPGDGRLTVRDLWEILSLPVLFALAAIAVTWLVWYFTSASCSQELALTTGCNPSRITGYVNLEILNKMVTHAAIAAGGGGLWSYAVITRERRAREAAEKQLAEVLEKAAEERMQAAEERAQAAAERAEERAQAAEERAQAAAERAEERAQAAEERRQFLALIEQLTERLNSGNRQDTQ